MPQSRSLLHCISFSQGEAWKTREENEQQNDIARDKRLVSIPAGGLPCGRAGWANTGLVTGQSPVDWEAFTEEEGSKQV